MRRLLFIVLAALSLASCTPSRVRELEAKNPLKDSADIWFEFQGQQIEDGRILCLNKGDVTRLIKAFNLCESELYKAIPISTNQ